MYVCPVYVYIHIYICMYSQRLCVQGKRYSTVLIHMPQQANTYMKYITACRCCTCSLEFSLHRVWYLAVWTPSPFQQLQQLGLLVCVSVYSAYTVYMHVCMYQLLPRQQYNLHTCTYSQRHMYAQCTEGCFISCQLLSCTYIHTYIHTTCT